MKWLPDYDKYKYGFIFMQQRSQKKCPSIWLLLFMESQRMNAWGARSQMEKVVFGVSFRSSKGKRVEKSQYCRISIVCGDRLEDIESDFTLHVKFSGKTSCEQHLFSLLVLSWSCERAAVHQYKYKVAQYFIRATFDSILELTWRIGITNTRLTQ